MTGLTVPRAGVIAGRAPSLAQTVEPDQTGGAIAEFGNALNAIGTALDRDRLDRDAARLQVDMTRDLGELRLNFEQMNDPDQIASEFEPRLNALKKSYFEPGDDAPARVDPKIRDRMGLAFDDLANRHRLAIGQHQINMTRDQRDANWLNLQQTLVSQAGAVDARTREGLVKSGLEAIQNDLASGAITPVEAARRSLGFQDQVHENVAIRLIDADPQGFLDMEAAGDFNAMDPISRARHTASAHAKLKARETVENKEIGEYLADVRSIAGDGLLHAQEYRMDDPRVKAHPDYAETLEATKLRNEIPGFDNLTPQELRAIYEAEAKKPVSTRAGAARVKYLGTRLAEMEAGYQNDPIDLRKKVGKGLFSDVPDLPAFDPADPGAFAKALGQRVAFGDYLVERGYVGKTSRRVLTNAERSEFQRLASSQTDPETRLSFARAIAGGMGGQKIAEIDQIAADPVFSHTVKYLFAGGEPALAEEIFRGQQALNAGFVGKPTLLQVVPKIEAQFGPVFQASETQAAPLQDAAVKAANALYAARQSSADGGDEEFDAEIYKQAMHEVMGGTGSYKNGAGGIQTVRDRLTKLPSGVMDHHVEDAMDAIQKQLRGLVYKPAFGYYVIDREAEADILRGLKSAAYAGQVPNLGNDPDRRWKNVWLQADPSQEDVYWLAYDAGGVTRKVPIEGDNDTPFAFSLRRLIQGTRE